MMKDNVEEYYKLLQLQKKYEEDIIDEDEMDKLILLYKSQIYEMEENLLKGFNNKSGDNK